MAILVGESLFAAFYMNGGYAQEAEFAPLGPFPGSGHS